MSAKTIVVTGGTSGIGEVAAVRLAEQGARIVLIARDAERADATLAKLKKANAGAAHKAHLADLSRLSEMKRVAGEIAAEEPAIDVLVNNAGALFNTRQVVEGGLEKTFATNHMAYFVVTNVLLPNLKATKGARIVTTASDAHRGAKLDFDDLQSEKRYGGFSVYGKSKLANILFNRELARRLDGSGVTANCLHPGFVATRFGDQSGGVMSVAVRIAKPIGAISPEEGAKTIVYLASSPDVEGRSGGYYYKNKLATPTKEAQSDADAKRLWDISAKIAGLGA
jgi:retinol dehydrogenase 12